MLDEDLDRPCLGRSGSSSLASSTLIAPGLEDDFVPPAGPSAHPAADDGPALMTGPSLPPTSLGPATSSGPGPYVDFAFGAAEPSGSEFYSFNFTPGTTNASSFGPEPLQFGSDSVIYSFGPWISPDELSALFGQGPTFLFFEPEFSVGPMPTSFGPDNNISSFMEPPARCSFAPRPNDDGYSHNMGAGQASFGPRPNGNESNGSNERTGSSPNIGPGHRANDPRMGPGSTSFGNDSFPNIGPGPLAYDPRMGPGPSSFGPGPHPESTTYDCIIGPGPTSCGPVPVLDPRAPSIAVKLASIKSEACKRFLCFPCSKGFDRIEQLERHEASNSHTNKFAAEGMPLNRPLSPVVFCPLCDQSFSRQDNLRPHLLRHMGKGPRARTRQISVEESISLGLAHIDPRLRPLIPDSV